MMGNSIKKAPHLIVELLESFSDKELKGLQKMVNCAYFNTDRYVIKLLEVLIKKILHQTNINQVIQLRLYNQVFSDLPAVKKELKPKQKAILRSKISSLTRLAERFLTIEALEQSDVHQYDLKLNALLNKKQYRLFSKHLKKADSSATSKIELEESLYFKYRIESWRLQYLYQTGQWLKKDNINELIKQLDLYYLTSKMGNTRTALAFKTRKPETEYDTSIINTINDKFLSKYFNGDYPYLNLEIASIQLSLQQTPSTYKYFLDLLKRYETLISKIELKGYYTIALNFCTRMSKMGRLEFYKNHVSIFQKLHELNLLASNNLITASYLKNIILAGCKANEFKWAYLMIKKYTPFINKQYRRDVKKFNLGYIAFQEKDFKKAIDYLLEVNNFHKSYDMDKRMLILQSYYELESHYTEPTAQLFRSVEAFVMKNKQYTEVNKKMYKNTIRIFYNVYRYKHGVGKITLYVLQEKIKQAEYITSKAWLLEKIEELRK